MDVVIHVFIYFCCLQTFIFFFSLSLSINLFLSYHYFSYLVKDSLKCTLIFSQVTYLTHIHTHTYIHSHTHTHTLRDTHTLMHTLKHTHSHTQTHHTVRPRKIRVSYCQNTSDITYKKLFEYTI